MDPLPNPSTTNMLDEGVFKIKKLGKKEYTQKDRIMEINAQGVAYYVLPSSNASTKEFLDLLKEIYNPPRPRYDDNLGEDEDKLLRKLLGAFKGIKNLLVKKEDIKYEELDLEFKAFDEVHNPKKFKYPLELKQRYNKYNDKITLKHWICDMFENKFYNRFKKIYNFITKKKAPQKEIAIKPPEEKIKKIEEEKKDIKDKEPPTEVDLEIYQTVFYIEAVFQYLLKQYYSLSHNPNIQTAPSNLNSPCIWKNKYELVIIQIITKFKDICQIIVKKIVNDLYTKPFSKAGITPIVVPQIQNMKKKEQAVFLYYVCGINFTLTWHRSHLKTFKEKQPQLFFGAWHHLKSDFKNRDFFQDLMLKIAADSETKGELPRYPLACIIDYCGFRVLCESDIFHEDGAVACGLNKDTSSNYAPNTNSKEDLDFYKSIANLISNDRNGQGTGNPINPQTNNLSANRAQSHLSLLQTGGMNASNLVSSDSSQIPEVVIPVQIQEKNDSSTQKFSFYNMLRYYSKQFKEIDTLLFAQNSALAKFLWLDTGSQPRNTQNYSTTGKVNHLDTSIFPENPSSYFRDTMIQSKDLLAISVEDRSYREFFEFSNPPKDKEDPSNKYKDLLKHPIRYIMDFRVLVEMKDKFLDASNKKLNAAGFGNVSMTSSNLNDESSTARRIPYFRPEFLVDYIEEPKFYNFDKSGGDKDESAAIYRRLKKYLFLEENTTGISGSNANIVNYTSISLALKQFKEYHISYLTNSLDSFFFKPYDSETLSEVFHTYGVNMANLGSVAEFTGVPHIRELCVIDMIARTCKKFIYDMISSKALEKACEDFYATLVPLDIASTNYNNNQNLKFVPTIFMVKYSREYLKKLLNLSKYSSRYPDDADLRDKKKTIEGLYRKWWSKCVHYNYNEVKALFDVKELKDAGKNTPQKPVKNPEKASSTQPASTLLPFIPEAAKEVAKFLNVLFGKDDDKTEIEIYGTKYNHKHLWAEIILSVKSYWNIDSREVFMYCDLEYISLPGLLNSIQYHTGIVINLDKVSDVVSNKDLINHEFTESNIVDIKPKVQGYSFRYFDINKNKIDIFRNEYCMVYDPVFSYDIHKTVMKKFFCENIQKNVSNFTRGGLYYLNMLKKWDDLKAYKELPIVDSIYKADTELVEYMKEKQGEWNDLNVFQLLANSGQSLTMKKCRFDTIHYHFLQLIEAVYLEMKAERDTSFHTNIVNSILDSCERFISSFWYNKHPYLCLLNLIYAKISLKAQASRRFEENVLKYFSSALTIAKAALGAGNIFFGNIAQEVALFHCKEKSYYEACKHLTMAYYVFSAHHDEFEVDYMKVLKKLTKYLVVLGYYSDAFLSGKELIWYYTQPGKIRKVETGFKWESYNIKAVIFNIIKIAKGLGYYKEGVEYCKILIYDNLPHSFPGKEEPIKNFSNWKHILAPKMETTKLSSSQNLNFSSTTDLITVSNSNINKKPEIKLIKMFKSYLNLIIKNLDPTDRMTYIQALVRLVEDKKEMKTLESYTESNEVLFESLFTETHGEGATSFHQFFTEKILHHLRQKFLQERDEMKVIETTNDEIGKNYTLYWGIFKKLYKIFKDSKIFRNYLDT